MSEAYDDTPRRNPEQERLAEELLERQAMQFLRYNAALLADAVQRQSLSAIEARRQGLRFVDIYTQETSLKVPQDRALSVLLTREGKWMRPAEPEPHYKVYFSAFVDGEVSETDEEGDGLINWVEKVEAAGSSTMHSLTRKSAKHTITDPDIAARMIEQGIEPLSLTSLELRELFDDMKTYRLAPQEHAPIAS